MNAIAKVAGIRFSTPLLAGLLTLSTLGLCYASEMAARASAGELGHAKAGERLYGKWCVGKVGCGNMCNPPSCGQRVDPMTGVLTCVVAPIDPGSAGVQNPGATSGTCTGTGVWCNQQNPSACGFATTPVCYVNAAGTNCYGTCVIAFGTATPGC